MVRDYQICKRCVMDTSDPYITFDNRGYCNHCEKALNKLNELYFIDSSLQKQKLHTILNEIQYRNKKSQYDCIIGLSGGTDSSYLAYYIVRILGLNPLAVHIDNGWNTEFAIHNIENIVKKLGIDLTTYVINWEEFRELQLAYLKSSVIDIEVLSDNPIFVVISRIAKKYRIKHFLAGMNITSESIMPASWLYPYKSDPLNIKAIYKKHGNGKKLNTYPIFSLYEYFVHKKIIKNYNILNYVDYNKNEANKILKQEIDWIDYGGKHNESFITKFYQNYILPKKFNVDKRKAHLSSLIIAKQITRENALGILKIPFFKDNADEEDQVEFFIKKLGISRKQFDEIMNLQPVSHYDYHSIVGMLRKAKNIIIKANDKKRISQKIY